jgi:hypothetical protein
MKTPIVIILVSLALAIHVLADGKMFRRETVPPKIPYQRALILFKNGSETLVLQSKYAIPKNQPQEQSSMGWVVPVPAVPEIASMPADLATDLFLRLGMVTRPRVTHLAPWFCLTLFFCLPALILLVCGLSFVVPFPAGFLNRRGLLAAYSWLALAAGILLAAGFGSGVSMRGTAGVDVILEQRVGIYDVQVVKATDAGKLIAWLTANEFKFGAEDTVSFNSYLAKGWCFVVAKIRPTAAHDEREVVAEGLAAPLILRFPVKAPIYPVALTATGGHKTEILIYLASATKMTCDKRLKLRYAGKAPSSLLNILYGTEPEGFFGDWDYPYLCKFKDTLSPADMTEDITFHPASDNEPYREHLVEW